MKTVHYFSNKIAIPEGHYEKFFHTASYIQKKSLLFDTSTGKNEIQKLMDLCGYSKKQKFILHRKEWDRLERKIPKKYLEGIGADINTFHFTLDLDREEFERISRLPFFPDYATVRIMPGIFQSLTLPQGITEEEAIEIIKIYAKEKNIRCFINLPDIKSIRFEPDGMVQTFYFPPDIQENANWFIPPDYIQIP